MKDYSPEGLWFADLSRPPQSNSFNDMMKRLLNLNTKYLQQLLSDLKSNGYIDAWSGDYYRDMINMVEYSILERTILK